MMLAAAISLILLSPARADPLGESLLSIENRWAIAAYETDGCKQVRDLKRLLDDVRGLRRLYPQKPETAAWHGIVASTYMDVKRSTSLGREARDALLAAESIDPLVLKGRVYAHLGALYSKVPSRFGGFGSKTRGIGYLWKALVVDPEGIDSNYLYAELLVKEKDYPAARTVLLRASEAPVRPSHPKSDRARKQEVAHLLAVVQAHLDKRS